MKTTTQLQMTTKRHAPGLSLLASVRFASLEQARAPHLQQAAFAYRDEPIEPIAPGFSGHRAQPTHYVRGGNP